MLALGGTLVVQGPTGRREIAATDFFTGFLATALAPDEMLVAIRVPKVRPAGRSFQKLNQPARTSATLGVAARNHGHLWRPLGHTGAGAPLGALG